MGFYDDALALLAEAATKAGQDHPEAFDGAMDTSDLEDVIYEAAQELGPEYVRAWHDLGNNGGGFGSFDDDVWYAFQEGLD